MLDRPLRELAELARAAWSWAVVALLFALGAVLERADPGSPSWGRLVLYGAAPALVLGLTFAVLARARHWLALAALAVAVSPTVLTAGAASLRPGAVAIVVASAVALATAFDWFADVRVRVVAGAGAAVLLVLAWFAAVRRFGPDRPGVGGAVGATGDFLRSVTGVAGRAAVTYSWSGQLLWWVGVGLVAAVALLSGRARVALLVASAVVGVCVFGWAVNMWRGPLDGRHLAWLLAGAVAYAGARAALPAAEERRLAVASGALAAASWLFGIVRVARLDGGGDAELAVEVVVSVCLLIALAAVLARPARSQRAARGAPVRGE